MDSCVFVALLHKNWKGKSNCATRFGDDYYAILSKGIRFTCFLIGISSQAYRTTVIQGFLFYLCYHSSKKCTSLIRKIAMQLCNLMVDNTSL